MAPRKSQTSHARKQKSSHRLLFSTALIIVVLVAVFFQYGAVTVAAGKTPIFMNLPSGTSGSGSKALALVPKFDLTTGNAWVAMAAETGGQICAHDQTSGASECTTTTFNFPVTLGDTVIFQAFPNSGYSFNYFQNSDGSLTSTSNPLIVTITQSAGTTGAIQAFFTQGSSSTTSSSPVHVADVWQVWTVHYADGSTQSYDSSQASTSTGPFGVSFDLTSTTQPQWMDIVFRVELNEQLQNSVFYRNIIGQTAVTVEENLVSAGFMSVVVNNLAQVGGESNLQTPLVFTPSDSVGTIKTWTARVDFSPGAPSSIYPTVDASYYFENQTKATVLIVNHQLWTKYLIYQALIGYGLPAYLNYACQDAQNAATSGGNPTAQCTISQASVFPQGGISFTWSPSAWTGGITATAPLVNVVTCPENLGGTNSICITESSFSTVFVTQNLTVTIQARATEKPIAPSGTGVTGTDTGTSTGGGGNGGNGTSCQVGGAKALYGLVNIPGISLPGWMCGKTFGINNVVLVLAALAFLILLFAALRRRQPPAQSSPGINLSFKL